MKRALFALVLAAALPVSAQASELSYSFVELDYLSSTDAGTAPFSTSADSDGYGLRGSFGFAEKFYVTAAYANSEFSGVGSGIDNDKWSVGFGFHHAMYDQADWFADINYTKIDSDFVLTDDSYFDVGVGLRGSISDRFEGMAKLSFNDGGNSNPGYYPQYDSAFSASIGLQWRITEMWGVVGEIEAYEDATDYTLGVRASF